MSGSGEGLAGQQSTPLDGARVISSIFRRIRGSEKGNVSFDEFFAYFHDRAVDEDLAREVFADMDQAGRGYIEESDMENFFAKDFYSFTNWFALLGELSHETTSVLRGVYNKYDTMPSDEQLKIRAFLRECNKMLCAVRRTIDSVMHRMEDDSVEQASATFAQQDDDSEDLPAELQVEDTLMHSARARAPMPSFHYSIESPADYRAAIASLAKQEIPAPVALGASQGSPDDSESDDERVDDASALSSRIAERLLAYKDIDLVELALDFRQNIPLHDHRHNMKTYKETFSGHDGVSWLVHTLGVTRREAEKIGQRLQLSGLFDHVTNEHIFRDSHLFFRFKDDEVFAEIADEHVPGTPSSDLVSTETGVMRLLRIPSLRLQSPPVPRESGSDELQPLVVLVNPKSGGKQGGTLFSQFVDLLGAKQVFDITAGGARPALEAYRDYPGRRILVAGGDGTVGWVLSEMDHVNYEEHARPPVAVLPLGTGNDLARVLNWGAGYTGARLSAIMHTVTNARPVMLDRWRIAVRGSDGQGKTLHMNNYFSIGFDAKIALKFHHARESHPERFRSRFFNKLVYAKLGARKMVHPSKRLAKFLEIEVDGAHVDLKSVTSVVILNIPSYSGGADLWGSANDDDFDEPAIDDHLVEVVGLRNAFHLGNIVAHLSSGIRLAQGRSVSVRFLRDRPVACQVDGEPWMQAPALITLTHHAQCTMLERVPAAATIPDMELSIEEDEVLELAGAMRDPRSGPKTLAREISGHQRDCVILGSALVDWVQYYLRTSDRVAAVRICQELLQRKLVLPAKGHKNTFHDRAEWYDVVDEGQPAEDTPAVLEPIAPFAAELRICVLEGRGLYAKSGRTVLISAESQDVATEAQRGSNTTNPVWGEEFGVVVSRADSVVRLELRNPFTGFFTYPISVLLQSPSSDSDDADFVHEGFFALLGKKEKEYTRTHIGELRVRFSLRILRGPRSPGAYCGLVPFTAPRAIGKVLKRGHVNHRCSANYANLFNVMANDESPRPYIEAIFEYGHARLTNAIVSVYVQRTTSNTEPWHHVGRSMTDERGVVRVDLADEYARTPGFYRVRVVAIHDGSLAEGQLFILEPGTKVVVFDMDGTLTVGDEEVVKQFAAEVFNLGAHVDLQQRDAAVALVRFWSAKGYLPIYLSGRQGSFYKLTRDWLIKKGFPPGPVHLTNTHVPTLPVYFSVGKFKVEYMNHLVKKLKLDIVAAYGNTENDIRAYANVGVPKDVTFISGFHGGHGHTVAVGKNFRAHLPFVRNFATASVPVPFVAQEWSCCSCNNPTEHGFMRAAECFAVTEAERPTGVDDARVRALARDTCATLRTLLGIDADDGLVLVPSGTDAEFLPLAAAAQRSHEEGAKGSLFMIVSAMGELGTGSSTAAQGRFFSKFAPDGTEVPNGSPLEGEAAENTVASRVVLSAHAIARDADGVPLPSDDPEQVPNLVRNSVLQGLAADSTAPVVTHMTMGSKTGAWTPSWEELNELAALSPRVMPVIDTCQCPYVAIGIESTRAPPLPLHC